MGDDVELVIHPILSNPECRDGKHGNCDGNGWDLAADTPCPCHCSCHAKSQLGQRRGH